MTDRTLAVAALVALVCSPVLFSGCAQETGDNGDAAPAPVASAENDGANTDVLPPAEAGNGAEAGDAAGNGSGSNGVAQDQPEVELHPAAKEDLDALLEKHKGDVVLVDFWGTWCIHCMEGFPHTVDLSRKYQKDGLRVISVAVESGEPAKALEFLQKKEANLLENLVSSYDFDTAFEEFDLISMPEYRVYDKEGELVRKFSSDDNLDKETAFDHTDIEAAVRSALGLGELEDSE